ncbi:hypothetical protein EMCRGX_G028469 [Ephydatia muelleri]
MNTMRWSVGEGWIAPPIPAKLVKPKAMSAGDLDYLAEQELGELEEEETDEQTEPVEIGEEELQAEREQSGERIEENAPRPPMIEGYLLLEENVQTDAWGVSRHCIEEATGKNYVLKTISNKKKVHVDARAVSMLRYLSHPNLVLVKEVRESENEWRIFHEVITTGTLQDWLNVNGPQNENAAALLTKQLLEVLQYLHLNGMVHYDLTPDRVYNSLPQPAHNSHSLQVNDLSLWLHLRPPITGPDVLLDKELGTEADMWAVGVLTFLILTGRMPFTDSRGDEYMFGNIVKGHIAHSDEWDCLSLSAKDFIKALLLVDGPSRLSAKQALRHAWISSPDCDPH